MSRRYLKGEDLFADDLILHLLHILLWYIVYTTAIYLIGLKACIFHNSLLLATVAASHVDVSCARWNQEEHLIGVIQIHILYCSHTPQVEAEQFFGFFHFGGIAF